MSDSYDDYEAKMQLAEYAWEIKDARHTFRKNRIKENKMSREAMQMALEALESDPISHAGLVSRKQAIAALRQALEIEQEPVAWASSLDFDDDDHEIIPAKDKGKLGTSNCDIPLYTVPKQWQVLTDEQVEDEWKRITGHSIFGGARSEGRAMYISPDEVIEFSRAIEAKLKEKNQ